MLLSFVHPSNSSKLISLIFSGITILLRFSHSRKIRDGKYCMFLGRLMLVSCLHDLNAPLPILQSSVSNLTVVR